jgi:hypothetical protein
LAQILLSGIKKKKDKQILEIFLFWSTDEELVDFYEALLNPEKITWYINRQKEKLQNSVNELSQIKQLFVSEEIKMMESLEKEGVDEILEDI